jgi:hypothetical protein
MPNKIHTIVEDAEVMNAVDAPHTFRIGLLMNTIMQATPVQIDDVKALLTDEEVNLEPIRKHLPMALHFNHGFPITILVVVDPESNHIDCYPFSNNNIEKKWWAYDSAFVIESRERIQLRVVNSWAIHADPTKSAIDHMEALATMVNSTLSRLGSGEFELYDLEEDHSKINQKREVAGKIPILNTLGIRRIQ